MAYSASNILEADDRTIGALGLGLVFIGATAGLLGFVSQNTTIFDNNQLSKLILQFFLAFGFLFILAIFSNYKGLDVLQDHAYTIIKWSYLIGIGLFLAFLVIIGVVFLPIGGIALGIAALVGFLFWRSWSFIHERIVRAAEWLKISVTIVLNEPGMVVLSFIQSIVVGITVIVEAITLFAWTQYAEAQALADNTTTYVVYGIMFLYLWLSLTVIYFFDGANTFISYARIHAKDPKVGQGLNAASNKILAIVGYALISALVYFITRLAILKSYEMRSDSKNMGAVILSVIIQFVAQIALWLYHLVSFFTLPSIIIRQNSTTEAMGESKDLFGRTFWDMIISEMGYSYGANILYIVTGLLLAAGGFAYGYLVASAYFVALPVVVGIIMAIIALIFGLFTSRFFLKPLYTALVTTMYVYATEGPESLKIVPTKLKSYLESETQKQRYHPNGGRGGVSYYQG